MRDWHAFVRGHLALPDLTPAREARIVRELAAQLEDFYREALAGGASEADADAQGQREDSHDRETRRPGELTERVARVAHDVGKH